MFFVTAHKLLRKRALTPPSVNIDVQAANHELGNDVASRTIGMFAGGGATCHDVRMGGLRPRFFFFKKKKKNKKFRSSQVRSKLREQLIVLFEKWLLFVPPPPPRCGSHAAGCLVPAAGESRFGSSWAAATGRILFPIPAPARGAVGPEADRQGL